MSRIAELKESLKRAEERRLEAGLEIGAPEKGTHQGRQRHTGW
jgi:hypothetical protein